MSSHPALRGAGRLSIPPPLSPLWPSLPPCALLGQGLSGLSWSRRLLESPGPAHLITSRAGSAAFTDPIKHCSWSLEHTVDAGSLSILGQDKSLLNEVISQTHKPQKCHGWPVPPKDNYRVTPGSAGLCEEVDATQKRPRGS